MNSPIAVDASFLVKLILPEEGADEAASLWESWVSEGRTLVAPTLLPYEAASAIRKQVQRAALGTDVGEEALSHLQRLLTMVILIPPDELHEVAWGLAERYRRPNLYDAYYVALAASTGSELWTSDARLQRTMPGEPNIRVLGQEA
jgi:predicted nucleic acid-binding protein